MKSIVSVPVSFNASIKPKTQQEMKKNAQYIVLQININKNFSLLQ